MSAQYPAPWTWEEHQLSEGYACIVYDANGDAVSSGYLDRDTASTIAAAPDLLEALACCRDALVAIYKSGGAFDVPAIVAQADSALAKAEGREL